jgi:hypothetical protein
VEAAFGEFNQKKTFHREGAKDAKKFKKSDSPPGRSSDLEDAEERGGRRKRMIFNSPLRPLW